MSFSPFSSKFAPPWNHHILLLQVYKRFASFQPKFCVKHESKSKCEMSTSCSANCRGERNIRGLDPRGEKVIRARILLPQLFLHVGSEAFFKEIRARIAWPQIHFSRRSDEGSDHRGWEWIRARIPLPCFHLQILSSFAPVCSLFHLSVILQLALYLFFILCTYLMH